MSKYRFFLPITVRYSDIDAQGHVNNTRFGTYIESARLAYLQHLGLWDGKDFLNLGVIVADVHIAYRKPIVLGQDIKAAVAITHIGTKSLKFEFEILDSHTNEVLATAETINVGFDYAANASSPISDEWRAAINQFEGTNF